MVKFRYFLSWPTKNFSLQNRKKTKRKKLMKWAFQNTLKIYLQISNVLALYFFPFIFFFLCDWHVDFFSFFLDFFFFVIDVMVLFFYFFSSFLLSERSFFSFLIFIFFDLFWRCSFLSFFLYFFFVHICLFSHYFWFFFLFSFFFENILLCFFLLL